MSHVSEKEVDKKRRTSAVPPNKITKRKGVFEWREGWREGVSARCTSGGETPLGGKKASRTIKERDSLLRHSTYQKD